MSDTVGTFPRGFHRGTRFPWPLVRADQLVELVYGKALPESRRRPGTIPVYGTNGRCGWHDEALRPGPGIILGRKGMGPLGVEWSVSDHWVIDTAYSVRPLVPDLDLRFFYYLVKYIGLNHLKDGTSNPSLTRDSFGSQLLPLPPLEDQRRIASSLAALDDKIELNRQMNHTLEAIARAIFKSWFVDFDPVRAKMAGREPAGMDAETAALFPARLEQTALGDVPAGWEIGSMGDLTTLCRESIQPSEWPEEVFDHYSIPAFDDGRRPVREQGAAIRSSKFVVRPNVVLLSKLNPRFPRVWLPYLASERRAIASTEFLLATPRAGYSREYVYSLFCSDPFIERFSGLVTGTSGSHQRVKPNDFLEMPVAVPHPRVVEAFTAVCEPLFRTVAANVREGEALATIRDTLLPRLISGELRLHQMGDFRPPSPRGC